MPISPKQLLDYAISLSSSSFEMDCRMSANRAYYAAYHKCISLANDMDPPAKTSGGVHEQLVKTFENAIGRKYQSIAYMLHQSHTFRARADYDIGGDFSEQDRDTVIETCERIIGIVDSLDG